MFNSLSREKKGAILILFFLILAITFETSQQLFYINRFNIREGVTFFDLLKGQSFQWVIWLLMGIVLVFYSKKKSKQSIYNFTYFLSYFILCISLSFFAIFIISVIQIFRSEDLLIMDNFFQNYLPFYTFQKGPIFILGYGAVSIILHLYFSNEQLQIQVQDLFELKETNQQLYESLKSEINDKTTVLNIKVGNKRKIIPIQEIVWIEADDYCVKVHLTSGLSYTMRSSLKALDEKLPPSFLRVHRKAIANMTMVKELHTQNSPVLLLRDETKIPISKSNLKEVKAFIS